MVRTASQELLKLFSISCFIELSEEIADCCFFIGDCINVGGLAKVDSQSFVGCIQFLESFIAATGLVWVSLQDERFELSGELSQGWKSSMKAKDQNIFIILRVGSHVNAGQRKTGSRRRGLNGEFRDYGLLRRL